MTAVTQDDPSRFGAAFELLSGPHTGVIVTDEDGVIERWSTGATAAFGWRREEAVGRTFREVAGVEAEADMLKDGLSRIVSGGLRTGFRSVRRADGTTGHLYGTGSIAPEDGRRLVVSLVVPADKADGMPEAEVPPALHAQWRSLAERALATVVAEEAEEALRRLTEFSRALGRVLELPQVLDRVARESAAVAGTRAVVYLRSEVRPDELRLAASTAIGLAELRDFRQRELIDPDSPNAVAARSGEPVWIETREQLQSRFPALAERAASLHAMAAVPLISEGEPIGTLGLAFQHPRRFRSRDRLLFVGLSDLAAQVITRAQVRAREQHLVATLQRAVLPADLPQADGLELAARYLPADDAAGVGGDWWDAFVLADGRFGVAVGDVAGHGLAAAGAMAKLRNALRAYLFAGYPPGEALGLLEALLETTGRDVVATAAAGVYDPATGTLVWSHAGHLPPLCIADGRAEFLASDDTGPLIGAGGGRPRATQQTAIAPGTTLLLYTDGLVEGRRRDVDAGLALLQHLASRLPADDLETLCDQLLDRVAVSGDDICVLAMRPTGRRATGP